MMGSGVRLTFNHLSGCRAFEVDRVVLGRHSELILGRAKSAAVRFDPRGDLGVGRYHARIEPLAEPEPHFRLVDLESRNGTYLNGARLQSAGPLRNGDTIRFGSAGPELLVTIEMGF